ncbi:Hypothetical predicted protein [Mytilus galloprovincialis]|uniref:Ig-like domain-containing protein n=1 Tax=Mytilus galloprovincialis TaxID=29158 RepID=A0A8B6CH39_MYTGA|nr:Hypothetical predicted protein [Mytilus galloprovincialis]
MSGTKLEDTGTMLLVCAIDLINKSQNIMTMFTMSIVFWEIKDLAITSGGNVTLFCNTTSVPGRKVTWMKKSDVIVHHGLVFYRSKFAEYSVSEGSFLTIMNANETDFGVSYTCIADIFSFDSMLDLDVLNVSVLPNDNDVHMSWNLESRKLLQIYFSGIFPIPHCQIFHKGTNILQTPTTTSERDGYFYNVSVSIVIPYQLELCDGYLDVKCSLNNQTIPVGNKRALPVCNDSTETNDHTVLLIVLGILVLVLLHCVLSRIIECEIRTLINIASTLRTNPKQEMSSLNKSERMETITFLAQTP